MINLKLVLEKTEIAQRTYYKYKEFGLLAVPQIIDIKSEDQTDEIIKRIHQIQYYKSKGLTLEDMMLKFYPYYIKSLNIDKDKYLNKMMDCLTIILQFSDSEFEKYLSERELTKKDIEKISKLSSKISILDELDEGSKINTFNWKDFNNNVINIKGISNFRYKVSNNQVTIKHFTKENDELNFLHQIKFISEIISDDLKEKYIKAVKEFKVQKNIEKVKKEMESK